MQGLDSLAMVQWCIERSEGVTLALLRCYVLRNGCVGENGACARMWFESVGVLEIAMYHDTVNILVTTCPAIDHRRARPILPTFQSSLDHIALARASAYW
jgi:hypothetical protein